MFTATVSKNEIIFFTVTASQLRWNIHHKITPSLYSIEIVPFSCIHNTIKCCTCFHLSRWVLGIKMLIIEQCSNLKFWKIGHDFCMFWIYLYLDFKSILRSTEVNVIAFENLKSKEFLVIVTIYAINRFRNCKIFVCGFSIKLKTVGSSVPWKCVLLYKEERLLVNFIF